MDGRCGRCVYVCVCVCVVVGVGVLKPRWVLGATYLAGAPGRWSDSASRSAAAPRSALSYSTRPSV